ncbi:MAG: hypothetical protein PHI12_08620 [Dehalococcoidales bacterium]|nr:hypothetical protein [Dehalococcoidales bacterium]
MNLTKGTKIVKVEWKDAFETNGWSYDLSEMVPADCVTIGYLIQDCETHITIASSTNDAGVCNCMTIPRGCIVKITELKED